MSKDLPDLLQVIGQDLGEIHIAQLKGRNNYLCLRRWDSWRHQELSGDELKFLLRIMVWLSITSTGDRSELKLTATEPSLWNKICAQENNCLAGRCTYHQIGRCFLHRARRQTERAHIVVINHALLLSDMAKGGKILPQHSHLIIDEAHHLEEEATKQLGFQVGEQDVLDYLNHLCRHPGGLLPHIQNSLQKAARVSEQQGEIEKIVEGLCQRTEATKLSTSRFFGSFLYLLHRNAEGFREYELRLRLTRGVRRHPEWLNIESAWSNLSQELGNIEMGLTQLYSRLDSLPGAENYDLDHLMAELFSVRQQAQELRRQIQSIINSPEPDTIYWLSLEGKDSSPYLYAAPLHVGPILEKNLFSKKDCVVLTSATLSTEGTFEFIKERLGLKKPDELLLDTPFDYLSSTLIYLPQDIPPPDKPGYQSTVESSLVELCRAVQGYTLILFTSHAALRTTYAAIQPSLEKTGVQVLGQGIDGGPKKLLDTFKSNPGAILLGTSSLWEGIDVMGKALSVLVIVRLPFSVPTEPVFAARSELFEDAFDQYALPQAILRFKQGFGRLIRSREDRGVLVVLDQRLQAKYYGRAFLASLPPCTIKRGRLRGMPEEVLGWLNQESPRRP